MTKCKVIKTTLTPWGELVKGDELKAEGGKLKALLQLNIIEEVKEQPKVKPKAKSKKDA